MAQQVIPDSDPQALITITVAGSETKIRRSGPLEDLIGERSLDLILADFLDTGFLNQLILNSPQTHDQDKRAALEIASLLSRNYSVSVCRDDLESDGLKKIEAEVTSPAEQKGLELATRIDRGGYGAPWYSLHLHLKPAADKPITEQSYEERVEALKRELRPKIESLNLSGLFRGNMQLQGEAFRDSQKMAKEAKGL